MNSHDSFAATGNSLPRRGGHPTSIGKSFFISTPTLSSCNRFWPARRGFTLETIMGCKRESLPHAEGVLMSFLKFLSCRIAVPWGVSSLPGLSAALGWPGSSSKHDHGHIRPQFWTRLTSARESFPFFISCCSGACEICLSLLSSSPLTHCGIWVDWGGAPPAGCNSQAPWSVASWHWIWPKGDTGGRPEVGGKKRLGCIYPSQQISRSHMSSVLQLPWGDPASGLWYPLLLSLLLPPAGLCCGWLLGASPTRWASQLAPPWCSQHPAFNASCLCIWLSTFHSSCCPADASAACYF